MLRRIAAEPGGDNLAVSLARLPTKRKVVHGVVVSPDNRYASVSVEDVGSAPGTVEAIDLVVSQTVAPVEVAQQAARIDFWKTAPASKP